MSDFIRDCDQHDVELFKVSYCHYILSDKPGRLCSKFNCFDRLDIAIAVSFLILI